MLRKRVVSLDMAGLDQKAPDTQNIPGTLDLLENGFVTKTSKTKPANEIRKRFGSSQLPTTTNMADGTTSPVGWSSMSELVNFKGRLTMRGAQGVYSYSPSDLRWTQNAAANTAPVTQVSTFPVWSSGSDYRMPDQAVLDNLVFTAFVDSTQMLSYTIQDRTTNVVTRLPELTLNPTPADGPRVVASNGFFYVFYNSGYGGIGTLRACKFDKHGNIQLLNVTVANTDASLRYFDVVVSSGKIFVAYYNSGTKVAVLDLNTLLPAQTTSVTGNAGNYNLKFLVNSTNNGTLYLGACDTSLGISVVTLTEGLAQTGNYLADAANTGAETLTGYFDGTYAYVISGVTGAYQHDIKWARVNFVSGAAVGTVIKAAYLNSRPALVDGRWYIGITYASTAQAVTFLMTLPGGASATGGGKIVAKIFPGAGAGRTDYLQALATALVDGTTIYFPTGRKVRLTTSNGFAYSVSGIYRAEVNIYGAAGKGAVLGNSAFFNGGVLSQFDGSNVVEAGFHVGPDVISASPAGSGTLAAGTYNYIVCYEWVDSNGEVHRSAPSAPLQITTNSPQNINVTVPYLHLTSKGYPVSIAIYRTKSLGTLYYKVTDDLNPIINNPYDDAYVFNDFIPDSAVTAGQPLYTTGAVLANESIPSAKCSVVHRNRLIIADEDDQVWVSKELIPGDGIGFSTGLKLQVPKDGGSIVALVSIDSTLLIFKTGGIFQATGDFPGPTGLGQFPPILSLSCPLGISGPNAFAVLDTGVIFQATTGQLWLLSRGGFQLQYIGGPVENETAPITDTLVNASPLQVRFFTATGRTLVYDVALGLWSVFTPQPTVGCAYWGGVPSWVSAAGIVSYEAPNQFHDQGAPIITRIGISDIGLAGILGYVRCWKALLRGVYCGPHHFRLSVSYDGSKTVAETFDANSSTLFNPSVYGGAPIYGYEDPYGGSWDGVWEPEFKFATQKCQTLHLTLEDSFPEGSPSEGFRLQAMGFLVGTKAGQMAPGKQRVAPS